MFPPLTGLAGRLLRAQHFWASRTRKMTSQLSMAAEGAGARLEQVQ
jgi:hypothetical protein